MFHRFSVAAATMAVIAAGVVLAGAADPAAAGGSITPWSTSVATGATFSVTANGCPLSYEETVDGFVSQQAELVLVTGTGPGERMAGYGRHVDGARLRFRVPGWVDPDQPAVVAGRCVRTSYSYTDADATPITTVFTFADAPIDIVAGDGPVGPLANLSRNTAAGGQVVAVSGSGCGPGAYADVALLEGGDLSGRTAGRYVTYASSIVAADGTFTAELTLLREFYEYEDSGGGPVPEGDYSVVVACGNGEEFTFAAPQMLTVAGTFPSDQVTVGVANDLVTAAGTGCGVGETVTVRFEGYAFDEGYEGFLQDRSTALAQRGAATGTRLTPGDDGTILETVTTTVDLDGTWTVTTPEPATGYDIVATADCGDPFTIGFRYVPKYLYESQFADLYVERSSPTSSPTGGQVTFHVFGECDGAASVVLLDGEGTILAESNSFDLVGYGRSAGTLTAPSAPGEYQAAGRCDDAMSYPSAYTVFSPDPQAAAAPLRAGATAGWPSEGPRQIYEGRIGPITLPPMQPDGNASAAAKAMGPSGLFIDVPRPDGDFAITSMSFDLVDGDGNPVGHQDAHLHHFVIANQSSKNPACPSGTFGLPGEIIAASGAERTVFETGDPYGLVVRDSDDWTGVYEVMSRSTQPQEVYLSYDLTYRRDVDNVRPLRSYFGSTSGCGSFTWQIDGSGTPDVQSHYVEVATSGRLVGAGGHVHNGGLYVDLVNDRNRRLCRSELLTSDVAAHPPGNQRSQVSADDITATTVVEVSAPAEPPPEFYDDDPVIEGITNCALGEQVNAGERLRVDATYLNERARSSVMGIYTFHVWEGGGPAAPGSSSGANSGGSSSAAAPASAATAVPGSPTYTG